MMKGNEYREISRVAVDGVDVDDGSRVGVIAIRNTHGITLYVPAKSHQVQLNGAAVAELASALSPDAPASIVVSIQDNSGEWTHLPAQVEHRQLPERTLVSLNAAMSTALRRLKQFGFAGSGQCTKRPA